MKEKIKKIISTLFSRVVTIVGKTVIGVQLYEQVINYSMSRSAEVYHNGLRFKFVIPNTLIKWRIKSFSTKEPETLEWIDTLPEGSILWDIGANIGLYSIYAAQKKNCRVYAFEPSVFNLELLARNIYLNKLSNKICIVPFALSDGLSISSMRMTSTEWGGALSTFGKEF